MAVSYLYICLLLFDAVYTFCITVKLYCEIIDRVLSSPLRHSLIQAMHTYNSYRIVIIESKLNETLNNCLVKTFCELFDEQF